MRDRAQPRLRWYQGYVQYAYTYTTVIIRKARATGATRTDAAVRRAASRSPHPPPGGAASRAAAPAPQAPAGWRGKCACEDSDPRYGFFSTRDGFNVQELTRPHIPSGDPTGTYAGPASLPRRGHIEHALDVCFLRTAETGRAAAPHQQVGPHVIQEWHRYHSWISRSKESLQHVITNSVMMEDDIVAADVIFVALFAIVLVALLVAIILVAIVLFAKILS